MDTPTLILILVLLAAAGVAAYFYMKRANAPLTLASLAGTWTFTFSGVGAFGEGVRPFDAAISGTGLISIPHQVRTPPGSMAPRRSAP